jgi:hypothetical protein
VAQIGPNYLTGRRPLLDEHSTRRAPAQRFYTQRSCSREEVEDWLSDEAVAEEIEDGLPDLV